MSGLGTKKDPLWAAILAFFAPQRVIIPRIANPRVNLPIGFTGFFEPQLKS
jgi:hypothetical protein